MANKHFLAGWFVIAFLLLNKVNSQTPTYWGNLRAGKYLVGHKSLVLFDENRVYDYTLGDSIMPKIEIKSRPILLHLYFPANKKNEGSKIKLEQLWQFSDDHKLSNYFSAFNSYQVSMAKKYAINQNTSGQEFTADSVAYNNLIDTAFGNYCQTELYAKDGLLPIHDTLPIIIYHQGLGGTLEDNLLLYEFLASHGFLVITGSFASNDVGVNPGVGDTAESVADLDFIIDYARKNLSKNKTVFLAGHSFGANSILTYPALGKNKIAGIAALDSDFYYTYYNQASVDFKQEKTKYQYKDLPIFAAGRTAAHFNLIDQLTPSVRYFLNLNKVNHNDFCSQSILGVKYCKPFSSNTIEKEFIVKQYELLGNLLLTFFKTHSNPAAKPILFKRFSPNHGAISTVIQGEKSVINRDFTIGKGNCPTNSQIMDLINRIGMQKAGVAWLKCNTVQDSLKFDPDWFFMYEALVNKESTKSAIDFLDWFCRNRKKDRKIGGFAYFTFEAAFVDRGKGFHYNKAYDIFDYLIKNVPDEIAVHSGYILCKGMQTYLASEAEKPKLKEELVTACLQLTTKFPDFELLPTDNYWEQTAKALILKYGVKK